MPTPTFPSERAFALLAQLVEQARGGSPHDAPPGDPLGLLRALTRHLPGATADPVRTVLSDVPALANIDGTLPGREPGPTLVLAAPYRPPHAAASAGAQWGADADAGALAMLLTVAEVFAQAPPLHETRLVLLAAPDADPDAGTRAFAPTLNGQLHGVLVLGQVAGSGAHLDVDVRSLLDPRSGALLNEVFLLGRALGHTPFAGGAELAFPGPHAAFLEAGLPAVALTDTKNPLAATPDDRPERCDPATLAAVGDVVLRLLHGERVV